MYKEPLKWKYILKYGINDRQIENTLETGILLYVLNIEHFAYEYDAHATALTQMHAMYR